MGDELVAVAACFGPHIAFQVRAYSTQGNWQGDARCAMWAGSGNGSNGGELRQARGAPLAPTTCTLLHHSLFTATLVQDVEPIELLEAVQEGVFEAASQPHLEGREVRLTLAVAPGSTDRSAAADASTAQLHLVLPPGYPERAAAGVEAVTCSALGRAGEAAALARLQAVAHEAAAAAPQGGGHECVYRLVEALLEEVSAAAEAAAAAAAERQAAAAAPPAAAAAAQQQQQLAVLRLDHMHAGAAYSRTLKGWARDLGLGGRLLFCGGRRRRRRRSSSSSDGRSGSKGGSSSSASPPIILILLEGPAPAVKEFVFRLRTRNVDVDSKGRWMLKGGRAGQAEAMGAGRHAVNCSVVLTLWPPGRRAMVCLPPGCLPPGGRHTALHQVLPTPVRPLVSLPHHAPRPCRERMMAEIAVQHRQQGGTPPPHDGSCSGAGAGAGGGRQAVGGTAMPAGDAALFGGTFLEEELGVPALAALLAHCGLTQHWRAATGLPGTPPAAGL